MESSGDGSLTPRQKNHTTLTRLVGISLPNGKYVEAPVEIWISALLKTLNNDHLTAMMSQVEQMNAHITVIPLDDGMGLVKSPITHLAG